MVKMDLVSSDDQASSMNTVSANRIAGYQSALSALESFSNASELTGAAYDSAKHYGARVLTPLIQGAILLSEGVSQGTTALPNKYRAEVGEESLDSEILESQIQAYESSLSSLRGIYRYLERDCSTKPSTLRSMSSRMTSLSNQKTEAMEKLRKLNAFAMSSPRVFSNLPEVSAAMDVGIGQVQTAFANFNGSFQVPSADQLGWAKTIGVEWKKKEQYEAVVKKAKNGEKLTNKDVQVVTAYAQKHPDVKVDIDVVKAIKDYVNKVKNRYDKNSTKYDVYANIVEQLGLGVQRLGGLLSVLGGVKGPATVNAQGVSTAFVLINKNGVGQALARNGSKIASVGKWGGRALTGIGFGLGMFDDIANNSKSVGQATVHNGLSTGLSWGAGAGTAAIGAFLVSNPVGWAAAGIAAASFAASYVVNLGFEAAYKSNFLGLQDGLDAAGDWLDNTGKSVGKAVSKGIDSAKNWAKDTADGVGDAISGGISALNPFD